MSWFAAILLPQFSLQAALRFHEEAWAKPVAIVDGNTEKGRIVEITEPAAQSGVWQGMVVTQALARCPSLRLLQRSRMQEEVVSALLLETAGTLSPFIEATAEGLCVADLRQIRTGDWEQWAREAVERFASRELRARIGLAMNPDLAALAAGHAEPALVVQHPDAFLAGVAVSEVNTMPELMGVLRDWGISHLGELARLSCNDLVERLGPGAGQLWEQAAGRAQRELRLVRPPEIFCEVFEFECPIETVEPLLFILRRQLEQLTLRLTEAYRVAARMTLTILLEPGPSNVDAGTGSYERVFTVPSPTGDVGVLFRILHTHLESLRLEQQPIGVRLRLEPTVAERSQYQLFESALRDPNRFGETLGRIAAIVGAENVGVIQLEDTHRPDQFQLTAPEFHKLSDKEQCKSNGDRLLGLPLRRFRPSEPAQIEFDRHIPLWVSSRITQGEVIHSAGPYRVSGEWWDKGAWALEEWDVELSDGSLYRISKSRGTCFLEGCYDAEVR